MYVMTVVSQAELVVFVFAESAGRITVTIGTSMIMYKRDFQMTLSCL